MARVHQFPSLSDTLAEREEGGGSKFFVYIWQVFLQLLYTFVSNICKSRTTTTTTTAAEMEQQPKYYVLIEDEESDAKCYMCDCIGEACRMMFHTLAEFVAHRNDVHVDEFDNGGPEYRRKREMEKKLLAEKQAAFDDVADAAVAVAVRVDQVSTADNKDEEGGKEEKKGEEEEELCKNH